MVASSEAYLLLALCVCACLHTISAQQCPGIEKDKSLEATGAGAGMSLEEQMTKLAFATYYVCDPEQYPDTTVVGWKQPHQMVLTSPTAGDQDIYTIYQHDNECVLSSSGTNSPADFLSNFDGRTTDWCGFPDVHLGFSGEVDDLLNSPDWPTKFHPYLKGADCSGGVTMVGHSLGGAQAALLAACANNGSQPLGFTVKAVYTVGGAAPAKAPLPNNEDSSGCFVGKRFYNHDKIEFDAITHLAQALGFRHVKMTAVCLARTSFTDSSYLGYYEYGCNTKCAAEYPYGYAGTPSLPLHLSSKYIDRVQTAYTSKTADLENSDCELATVGTANLGTRTCLGVVPLFVMALVEAFALA